MISALSMSAKHGRLAEQIATQLDSLQNCRRWWLAYSGGMDSTVLLDLLQRARHSLQKPPGLHVLHINHGLCTEADDWQRHCAAQCRAWELPFFALRVRCEGRDGLEANARRIRYRVFADCLQAGDVLFLAHHLDDQVETMLMRLCRGAGCNGLAGMPVQRSLGSAQLMRPLLSIPRQELHSYALARQLCWVEDAGNRDQTLDRNRVRHQILPSVERRWRGYRICWARAAALVTEAQHLNEELAALDMGKLAIATVLPLSRLRALSDARRRNLLRYWLSGFDLRAPGAAQLQEILREMLSAAPDALPRIYLDGYRLQRYRDCIYLLSDIAPPRGEHVWPNPEHPLQLPGMGKLCAVPSEQGGLRHRLHLQVHFRRGGERCRPQHCAHSRPLKKLLQEYGVPPWLRAHMPLVSVDNKIAAVGDLWVCHGFSAAPGETGLRLHWRPPAGTGVVEGGSPGEMSNVSR